MSTLPGTLWQAWCTSLGLDVGDWNPDHYLRFREQRTRPASDLVARIALDAPARVIDLGCGPGTSTQVLAERWPGAQIIGLDSSETMIAAARRLHPQQDWRCGSMASWLPKYALDVVFANASLQWLPDHGPLVQRLFSWVAPGGALAFQIPSAAHAPVRTLIHALARSDRWSARMEAPLRALTMESPAFYYDHLSSRATHLDIWESEYWHVLASADAVVDWMASTGLRPFLEALDSPEDQACFQQQLLDPLRHLYPPRVDGKVLFPFRRTFVIAYA